MMLVCEKHEKQGLQGKMRSEYNEMRRKIFDSEKTVEKQMEG